MSEAYISEIRAFGFPFAPRGWALCNGGLLPVNQFQALFSLLGTTYGGNGTTTFGLPDLQGRVPMHVGPAYPLGGAGGEPGHTLAINEIPQHNHLVSGTTDTANQGYVAANAIPASGSPVYVPQASIASPATLSLGTLAQAGGNQPHENRQPFAVINYCIAVTGIFPSRG